jgi:hypothetical protein
MVFFGAKKGQLAGGAQKKVKVSFLGARSLQIKKESTIYCVYMHNYFIVNICSDDLATLRK